MPFPEESGDCSLWMSSSGGGLFDERRDSNPSLGAFVFGQLLRSNPSPCLAKDKHMKRVAVLLLLLSLATAAPGVRSRFALIRVPQ